MKAKEILDTIEAKPGDDLWRFGMALLLEEIERLEKTIEFQAMMMGKLHDRLGTFKK